MGQILVDLVIVFVVLIVAGYFVAQHHGRWRNFGIGAALGAAAPTIPMLGDGEDEDTGADSRDDSGDSGGLDSTSASTDGNP